MPDCFRDAHQTAACTACSSPCGRRPPPAIRDLLGDLQDGVPDARWQDDAQLHVTVRYIGPVEARVAEDVVDALASVIAPAMTVTVAGVGAFETRGRVTSLWAGLAPADPLAALHRRVDQTLVRTGLSPEGRAYRPHITLARLSRSAGSDPSVVRWLVRHAALSSEPFRLAELVLYESHVGRHGAAYEAIAHWPLGRPD